MKFVNKMDSVKDALMVPFTVSKQQVKSKSTDSKLTSTYYFAKVDVRKMPFD